MLKKAEFVLNSTGHENNGERRRNNQTKQINTHKNKPTPKGEVKKYRRKTKKRQWGKKEETM